MVKLVALYVLLTLLSLQVQIVLASDAESNVAIGIDLGTTLSLVSYYNLGQAEVLENDQGSRLTPSVVSISSSQQQVLVGEAALNNKLTDPTMTFSSIKRIIGRPFDHRDVQLQKQAVSYPIIQCDKKWIDDSTKMFENIADLLTNSVSSAIRWLYGDSSDTSKQVPSLPKIDWRRNDGSACIAFKLGQKTVDYPVEIVSALVLSHLRSNAERKIGKPVTKAVITVPAYFTENQRAATLDAAKIAGFEVLRLLPEPTAAALAFGLRIPNFLAKTSQNILVFDLGGGTFDVSIMAFKKGVFDVVAIGGDNHCGGDDLDLALSDFFREEFARMNQGLRIPVDDLRAKVRLLIAAEKAKKDLSFSLSTSILIDSLFQGIDFSLTLTRAKFDQICKPFFDKILPVVSTTLSSAELSASQIDRVLLVGGSSRIPKIRSMLDEFFTCELNHDVNPDEAVGIGAGILAYKLTHPKEVESVKAEGSTSIWSSLVDTAKEWWSGPLAPRDINMKDRTDHMVLNDVVAHSLGTATYPNRNEFMISRFSRLPQSVTKSFTTVFDNQRSMMIGILEGESEIASENTKLGEFLLEDIEVAKKGVPEILISYTVDMNGVLTVVATDTKTNSKNSKVLENLSWSRLKPAELGVLQKLAVLLLKKDKDEL